MHFRVRRNVIQLIRTSYDAGKKRGVNTTVATVKVTEPVLTAEIRALLTQEEIESFERWLTRHRHVEELKEEVAAMALVESLAAAQRWFEREGNSFIARDVAQDVMAQWLSLRRAWAKRGVLE